MNYIAERGTDNGNKWYIIPTLDLAWLQDVILTNEIVFLAYIHIVHRKLDRQSESGSDII
jgi:hypothetical protein